MEILLQFSDELSLHSLESKHGSLVNCMSISSDSQTFTSDNLKETKNMATFQFTVRNWRETLNILNLQSLGY